MHGVAGTAWVPIGGYEDTPNPVTPSPRFCHDSDTVPCIPATPFPWATRHCHLISKHWLDTN